MIEIFGYLRHGWINLQPQNVKYEAMLQREKKMVSHMISIYCKNHHRASNEQCADCTQAKEHIYLHLENCPYQEKKSACGRCGLKCYPACSKDKIMAIMTYSGPRMLLYHPGLALHHLWDARRAPGKLEKK